MFSRVVVPMLLLVGALQGVLIGRLFWSEYRNAQPEPGSVLTYGTVVRRESTQLQGGMKRPVLYIHVPGESQPVRAILLANASGDIPNRVSFYYSGNPSLEVRLQQEDDPLPVAIISWVLSAVAVLLALRFALRRA